MINDEMSANWFYDTETHTIIKRKILIPNYTKLINK